MIRRILLFSMLAGCFPEFDPASYVTGLRILAVKADPPELAPGETARLTPLLVDTRGRDGGDLRVEWSLCLQAPLPGQAVSKDCLSPDGGAILTPLGEGPTMDVTMPDVTAAELGVPDFTGGVYLPVVLRVSDGVETVDAVYRLRYTAKISLPFFMGPIQPPNHNPTLDDIQISYEHDAGQQSLGALEIHAHDRIALRATFAAGSHETYPQIEGQLELPDGGISLDGGVRFFDGGIDVGPIHLVEVTEKLRVSWFTTIGRVDPDVTGEVGKLDTTLKLDKFVPDAPADIDLYVVVRDDRGGCDFTSRKLLLR